MPCRRVVADVVLGYFQLLLELLGEDISIPADLLDGDDFFRATRHPLPVDGELGKRRAADNVWYRLEFLRSDCRGRYGLAVEGARRGRNLGLGSAARFERVGLVGY